jgi:hypothetical protein
MAAASHPADWLRRRRRLEVAQQHRRSLDLQAFAGGSLDLQRCVIVGKDGAGLELAVVLEKNVHGIFDVAAAGGPLEARIIAGRQQSPKRAATGHRDIRATSAGKTGMPMGRSTTRRAVVRQPPPRARRITS